MKTEDSKNISVVIPTYNGVKFIGDAIHSVFSQSYSPFEIIVVDDCSSDKTVSVVRALGSDSPIPIRIIELPFNSGGPSRPINTGVRAASTELIAVLDQDDIYLEMTLERASQVLHESPDCKFVFHWVGRFGVPDIGPWQPEQIRKELLLTGNRCGNHLELPGKQILRLMITHGNCVWGYPGFVFRKAAWEEKGGVDESLRIAGDMEFLMWMARHGNAALIPEVGYLRRVHEANVSHASVAMSIEMGLVVSRCIKAMSRAERQELGEQAAIAIESFAYEFRELHLYDDAMLFYSLLKDLGRSSLSISLLKAKCHAHRLLSRVKERFPFAAQS